MKNISALRVIRPAMQVIVIAVLTLMLAACQGNKATEPASALTMENAQKAFKVVFPNATVKSLAPSRIEGVYEVVVENQGILGIVYMNADALIKAFCGRNGGIVCTSSNAQAAFEWGFKRHDIIFFFPDQHLGRNTGNRMGIPG